MRIIAFLLIGAALLFSCKTEPKRTQPIEEKNEIDFRMSFLLDGNTISLGDTVVVMVSAADSIAVDDMEIEAGGKLFPVKNGQAKLPTHHLKAGRNVVSGILKHGGKEIRKSLTLVVKNSKEAKQYGYKIISTLPHDPQAYTQGFVWHEGSFYEGTGLEKKSSLREVDEKTGTVKRSISLAPQYFGEGVAIYKDKIYQLTWKNRKGFVYDLKSFQMIKEFSYATEGWGLTTMDSVLVMSDGSEVLYILEPEGLSVVGKLEVYNENGPVGNLNELEFIDGLIWANIYGQELIVQIDPKTGFVVSILDASELLNWKQRGSADVLNGIAYDSVGKRIFLTGKLWPNVFQIEMKARPQP